ncbi:MAG: hypothetical protein KC620_12285 [Myxococcales bacterium]|nr:hypothetical protein [Myxococcales bacterium]
MSNGNPDSMSDDALREEHRRLQERLNALREERALYEPTGTSGSGQTQSGSRDELARIDHEMAEIRRRQRALYESHQARHPH